MIDAWQIDYIPSFVRYRAEHDSELSMTGPHALFAGPPPSGYVVFHLANSHNHSDYKEIVLAAFPDSSFTLSSERYFLLSERDFSVLKLAAS